MWKGGDLSELLDSMASDPWRNTYVLPDSVILRRGETTRRVQEAIQRRFGSKYTVELFGSTRCVVELLRFRPNWATVRYGVSYPSSDLDMIILVSFFRHEISMLIRFRTQLDHVAFHLLKPFLVHLSSILPVLMFISGNQAIYNVRYVNRLPLHFCHTDQELEDD